MKFEEIYQNGIYYVTIVNTNKCNLSCRYCFESYKYDDVMDPQLTVDIIEKVYPLMRGYGDNKFKLAFFGGESLIGWESMKAAYDTLLSKKDFQFKTGLATNLTLLTDEMIDYWTRMDSSLTISIDGVKDAHNKNRNNTFDIVSKNIDRINEAGIDYELRMTCPFDQAHLLADNVKYLHKRFGARSIAPMPDSIDDTISTKQINSFRDSFFEIIDYYLENLNTDTEFSLGKYLNYLITQEEWMQKRCFYGGDTYGSITIDWNGNIVSCPDAPTSTNTDKYIYGNIFGDINLSKLFDKLHYVEEDRFQEKCNICRCYKSTCFGECYLYLKSDLFGNNIAACEIRKIYHDIIQYLKNRLK